MPKRYTKKHVFITLGLMAALVVVMYTSIVLRDYNLVFEDGIQTVAKTPVPGPPGFSIANSVPGKITVNIVANGSQSYDIQMSRFKNMAFGKTYRTVLTKKERGLMSKGKTYYVRCRSVAYKPGTTRRVHGKWGSVRSVTVRKDPER